MCPVDTCGPGLLHSSGGAFAGSAERAWRQMRPASRNPRYGRDWLSSDPGRFPGTGGMAVGAVTTADVPAAPSVGFEPQPGGTVRAVVSF